MTYQTTIEADGRDAAYASGDCEQESIKKAINMYESLCIRDSNLRKAGISLIRTVEISE